MSYEHLRPTGDPRIIGEAEVQYLADSSSHGHEGGHRIALDGETVLVLPDGRTSARKRSQVISGALQDIANEDVTPLEAMIGALVLVGATNIVVDGVPILLGDPDQILAALRLEVVDTGGGITIRVSSIGAS